MSLSFPARELLKGLWCEADDHGIFQWRPLTLKARIIPADPVDMCALLAELVVQNFIVQFDDAGRSYGAVRNFRDFQRPKKPTYYHPFPNHLALYVSKNGSGGEPVPHQNGTAGEKSPHREQEEGGKEGGDKIADARARATLAMRILRETGLGEDAKWAGDALHIHAWLAGGMDPDLDIIPCVRTVLAKRNGVPPSKLRYFDGAIAEWYSNRINFDPKAGGNSGGRAIPAGRDYESQRTRNLQGVVDALAGELEPGANPAELRHKARDR